MKDDGGPAFPVPASSAQNAQAISTEEWNHYQAGMTLRDYFAAAALACGKPPSCEKYPNTYEEVAAICFKYADAMIKERYK